MRAFSIAPGDRLGLGLIGAALVLFVAHRMGVIYSAGDFLFALEPSEAKHTQIAWDLHTGRFGTEGFGLDAYVANSGNVHHGSYFTCAMAYLAVSVVAGFDMLAVRITPLLFQIAGLLLLSITMLRRFGTMAGVLTALCFLLLPTQFIALQVSLTGSHSETVLPLTAMLAIWASWLGREQKPRWHTVLLGSSLGYAVAFSYLLLPVVGLVMVITLLPPRPSLPLRTWAEGVGGAVLGLWPLWLIIVLEPGALFTNSVTENPATTPLALAGGGGAGIAEILDTLARNLPEGAYDYWVSQATPPALWGGESYENWAWRLAVLGPVLVTPLAIRDPDPVRRKLGTLLALAPTLSYLFLAVATPWKPHIPVRYMIPMATLSCAAVGLAVGIGRARRDWMGKGLMALAIGLFLWGAGPRAFEAMQAIRPARWDLNAQHRLVTYYNLGIHTVWAEDVPAVNDLVDLRSASGDPRSFGGIQAALWGGGATFGLGRGSWSPVDAMNWSQLGDAIDEWHERQSYLTPEETDDPEITAENIGWGVGIRTRWNPTRLALILDQAGSDWPEAVTKEGVWEGFGMGWGRADPSAPSVLRAVPSTVPIEARDALLRGISRGRALGQVPRAPNPPVFVTVRGTAT